MQIGDLLWALARLDYRPPGAFMDALVQRVQTNIARLVLRLHMHAITCMPLYMHAQIRCLKQLQ